MRELLAEVLDLQREYSASNTPAMHRRGTLVRREIAEELREWVPTPGAEQITDLFVEGSDGAGLKSEIPWTRLASREKSPNARTGWDVVYLFSADGERVYLSLNQGTTKWVGGEFKPLPADTLAARVQWARSRTLDSPDRLNWLPGMDLRARKSLGVQYERGNVWAKAYTRHAIPDDGTLRDDIAEALRLLVLLYGEEAVAIDVPGESPEVEDAQTAADLMAGKPTRRKRILLTTPERRAIERHAVAMTSSYLAGLGYSVADVGATRSYDLHAVRDSEVLHVEVKGTTSTGSEVVLTANEVALHRREHPANALAVVHSVRLERGSAPTASGGTLDFRSPWIIAEEDLVPISYSYVTGL